MLKYRADIDGLRAIAVSSVVIYHAMPALLPSGYVGVDIFFAISGFLIGGIIYSGVTDRDFSYTSFYARRARRILPALMAVVMATLLIGFFYLDSYTYSQLSAQSISALGGFSNIYFWAKTNYFDVAAAYKPLLMTWSLGVEEQFYVIFPVLMLLTVRFGSIWRIGLVAVIIVASFAYSLVTTHSSPIQAFYLLPSRAWELGVGVLAAMLMQEKWLKAPSGLLAELLAVTGLAMLVASVVIFDHDTPFPGWAATLPVFGTLLLILTGKSFINTRLLSLKPVVFVGLISYSWYLWHWPLMAYVRNASDRGDPGHALLVMAVLSFFVAILSWRFIEQPFRNRQLPNLKVLARYAGVLAISMLIPLIVRLDRGMPDRHSVALAKAIAATDEGRGMCLKDYGVSEPDVPGTACYPEHSRFALIGDSHAAAAAPGLVKLAAQQGTTLAQFNKSACTPLLGYANFWSFDKGSKFDFARRCGQYMDNAARMIADDPEIETVYIVAYWPEEAGRDDYLVYADGELGVPAERVEAVREGLGNLVDRLRDAGKTVILAGDVPPMRFDPMRRAISDGFPLRRYVRDIFGLGFRVRDERVELAAIRQGNEEVGEIVRAIAEARPDVGYVDIRSQLCNADGCRIVSDGTPLFFDHHHLTGAGARYLDWGQHPQMTAQTPEPGG